MTNQDLVRGLKEDLTIERAAVRRYTFQAGQPNVAPELRELLERDIHDEREHAAFLSQAILDLGDQPVVELAEVDQSSDLKAMLAQDLELKQEEIDCYRKHARLAREMGLIMLTNRLEEIAADETRHVEALRDYLKSLRLLQTPVWEEY